jgi:hypothetical protein
MVPHRLVVGEFRTDCSCGENLSAPSQVMEHWLYMRHLLRAALSVTDETTCETCGGTGRVSRSRLAGWEAGPCDDCNGSGSVPGLPLLTWNDYEQVGCVVDVLSDAGMNDHLIVGPVDDGGDKFLLRAVFVKREYPREAT